MCNTIDNILSQPMGFCVECGASGGGPGGNVHALIERGWDALLIEKTEWKFNDLARYSQEYPKVSALHLEMTPDNLKTICKLMERTVIDYFVLDIDSYDYEVLESLMRYLNVRLYMVEINEKIPVPIEFFVKYRPDHIWTGDHFYGMSVQSLANLCDKFGYNMLSGCDNNVFISREGVGKSAEEIYAEIRPYAKAASFNQNVVQWLDMDSTQAVSDIEKHFGNYQRDLYHLSVGGQ